MPHHSGKYFLVTDLKAMFLIHIVLLSLFRTKNLGAIGYCFCQNRTVSCAEHLENLSGMGAFL